MVLLAQATPAQTSSPSGAAQSDIIIWVVILIVVILAAFALVLFLKHVLLSNQSTSADSQGLVDTMRSMRDRGELSHEEFDQARRALARKSVEEVEARLAAKDRAKSDATSVAAARIIKAAEDAGALRSDPHHRGQSPRKGGPE